MEYGNLGNSGLKVSKIIYGCMGFGNKGSGQWVIDDDNKVLGLMKYAYDRGVRTFDTADVYSMGDSERMLGRFLHKYNINRSSVVIMTKTYFPVAAEGLEYTPANNVNRYGLSRKHIMDAVEASTERLGTYIDVLQVHRFDPETPVRETMEALNDVVKSGKARYLGASSMPAHDFALMQFTAEHNNWTKFISMQNLHTLLYREEEREMNAFCKKSGVGLMPWGPLAGGLLTRPSDKAAETVRGSEMLNFATELSQMPASVEITKRVEELASKKNVSMAQVALAWNLARGDYPVVGLSSEKRIDDAIDALKVQLSQDDLTYLEEPYRALPLTGYLPSDPQSQFHVSNGFRKDAKAMGLE